MLSSFAFVSMKSDIMVRRVTGELGSIIRWYGMTHCNLDFETPPHHQVLPVAIINYSRRAQKRFWGIKGVA